MLLNYPNKKIYLLSEMIHNQLVNQDLQENGISFIMDTKKQLIEWDQISNNDIVIIPAFGTSLEVLNILDKNINTEEFNTTCPFVSKVWNRSKTIATQGSQLLYMEKQTMKRQDLHFQEQKHGPAIIVETMEDVYSLCEIIKNNKSERKKIFKNKVSPGFDFNKNLKEVGVVNQTNTCFRNKKNY